MKKSEKEIKRTANASSREKSNIKELLLTVEGIHSLINARLDRALLSVQAAPPKGQLRVFRKLVLDEFGTSSLLSDITALLGPVQPKQQRNEQDHLSKEKGTKRSRSKQSELSVKFDLELPQDTVFREELDLIQIYCSDILRDLFRQETPSEGTVETDRDGTKGPGRPPRGKRS